jgi:hypothetical protein
VVSLALSAVTVSGIVAGFMQSLSESDRSGLSLAAQAQAVRGLEQTRAAKWDPLGFPAVDQVVSGNFPVRVEVLDVPMSGSNLTYGTNYTTITPVSDNPPLKLVRVDCVWSFMNRGVFTNTASTYRAPDQ